MYMKRPRAHQHRPLGEHVARSVEENRDDRHAGCDRKNERTFLEGADRIVVPTRSFGKNNDRVAGANSFSGDVVRSERRSTRLSLNWNHSDGAYGRTENRNFEELGFGDELVSRQHRGQRWYVEPAQMIRHVDLRLTACHPLGAVNYCPDSS